MSNSKNTSSTNSSTTPELPCTCPYCQRRFGTMEQLTLHVVTRHTWTGKAKGEPAVSGK